MTRALIIDALRMAWFRRRPAAGLIFHSDRGSQYASGDFQKQLSAFGMRGSMSRIRLHGVDAPEKGQECFLADGTPSRCAKKGALVSADYTGESRVSCQPVGTSVPAKCALIPSEDQFYGSSKGCNRLARYVQ
ncbi:hypothetical protein AMST5_00081 [freshwater sediment metagenome]|uniref:Integrase catalytic domain-containing protein n=1 Tax=freshwater sediment metagenome TaxID=556182 RepID=A0AA48R9P4_9ZZZZ